MESAEIRGRGGVGDDPDREGILADFGDGEADAVDGHGAFVGQVSCELGGQFEIQAKIASVFFGATEGDRRVHMTLHEVPPQSAADRQGSLEIHAGAGLQRAEVGFFQGLFQQVKNQEPVLRDGDRQAATIHRDAVADPHSRENPRRLDRKLGLAFATAQPFQTTQFLDKSGEHLLSLIDGMLDIARIEAGKMRLESAELPLREFLDQIVQMVAPQAAQKGLGFHFVEAGRIPSAVHADEKRLRQILINLLANAVKFTDAGAVTLRVTYAREIAQFEVEDTGIGIAEDKVAAIFESFTQADQSTTRQFGGTGLGLAICKSLVEAMSGRIWVESKLDQGSRFCFSIPCKELADESCRRHPVTAKPGKSVLLSIASRLTRRIVTDTLVEASVETIEHAESELTPDQVSRFDWIIICANNISLTYFL